MKCGKSASVGDVDRAIVFGIGPAVVGNHSRPAGAAGIPIVPIVIRNAEIVAARNSTTINPGTVDVAVFPPISVHDWTLDNLPDRIAAVRQLYLDALADWPDEIPAERPKAAAKKTAKKAAPKAAVKTTAKPKTKKRDSQPAWRRAILMQRAAPSPSGDGAVT